MANTQGRMTRSQCEDDMFAMGERGGGSGEGAGKEMDDQFQVRFGLEAREEGI